MPIEFSLKESKVLKDIFIIRPTISNDIRGNIWTSFLYQEIDRLIPKNLSFKHDKFSISENNVLRGIHGDNKSWKLVSCVYGEIQQVIVDCNVGSTTYGKYESLYLNQKNIISVLIPPGYGNAYYVKSDKAVYHYKLAYAGNYFDYDQQFSRKWNDPEFSINWDATNPLLSERDK
tara:strand:- start:21 stop:545 length:525 start_codon:yes stop_codon:yes gene_type:complete